MSNYFNFCSQIQNLLSWHFPSVVEVPSLALDSERSDENLIVFGLKQMSRTVEVKE